MAIDAELYEAVRAARKQLRELHGEVKTHPLVKLVGRKTCEVLQVNTEIAAIELAEDEAAREKKIHKDLRDEIYRFGEAFADEKCQSLRRSLEGYRETEEILHGLISDLEGKQADCERSIEGLRQSVADLEMNALKTLGEINALDRARNEAQAERAKAETKYAGLKVTVEQKSKELREVRQKAKELKKNLDEATALDKQRQDEIGRLEADFKAVGEELVAEQKGRSETHQTLIKTQSRIEELTDEIDKLKKRKASTRAAASTSTNNK
jgi:chromosome segregation ATPase